MKLTYRPLPPLFLALTCLMGLAACQSTNGSDRPHVGANAVLVIDGIEGVPKTLQEPLRDGLEKGAQRHAVRLGNTADQAGLHLRGYLTAGSNLPPDQTATLVWDVFDAQENRIQRITSSLPSPAGHAALTSREAGQLAEISMADLARFLKE